MGAALVLRKNQRFLAFLVLRAAKREILEKVRRRTARGENHEFNEFTRMIESPRKTRTTQKGRLRRRREVNEK